ncbi:MAG: DUF1385 domain-containing protein, partial [Armatimonadota bacterium]|nr:DUF1385 domain-containing protein [Armatimonadota bacterium]
MSTRIRKETTLAARRASALSRRRVAAACAGITAVGGLFRRVEENLGYGGQAVLEGVMIRGPRSLAVAVRRADGRIVLKREALVPLTRRHPLFNIPFIRGAFALADAVVTGLRALSFSADVAMEEERERTEAAEDAARREVLGAGVAPQLEGASPVEVREVA